MRFGRIIDAAVIGRCLTLPLLAWWTPSAVFAAGYGIFDVRSQALSGTAVALANHGNGHFYNPALTAFHLGDEDRTRDGRHSLRGLGQVSDAVTLAYDVIENDLEGRLSNAIDNFNANPGAATAQAGEGAAIELSDAMTDLQGEDIFFDSYFGYSLTEPGDREGGTFFIGTRLLGGGVTVIEEQDIDLIDDYVEALQFIYSDGDLGEEHPELFEEGTGRLLDPGGLIESSASARGVAISEIGVSASRQIQLWGQTFALGFAPKLSHIRTFDNRWRVVQGDFDSSGEYFDQLHFDFDLGVAWAPTSQWRIGLAGKDLFSEAYDTALAQEIPSMRRARLGVAYLGDSLRWGLDIDLTENPTLYRDAARQDLALGGEYRLSEHWLLRGGYRHDLNGDFDGSLSLGAGALFGRFAFDLAIAAGSSSQAFGLEFAILH